MSLVGVLLFGCGAGRSSKPSSCMAADRARDLRLVSSSADAGCDSALWGVLVVVVDSF